MNVNWTETAHEPDEEVMSADDVWRDAIVIGEVLKRRLQSTSPVAALGAGDVKSQPETERVTTSAKIEILQDIWLAETGAKSLETVRGVEIDDALVDTGAMILSLPTRLIQQLGLRVTGQKRTITTGGPRMANAYQAVRLTVQDRDCIVEVLEVPDSVPVLIGQVPLEILDFVVDMPNRRLVGNPAHGGQQMFEMFWSHRL